MKTDFEKANKICKRTIRYICCFYICTLEYFILAIQINLSSSLVQAYTSYLKRKPVFQCLQQGRTQVFVLVCLMLNILINNFSVMLGQSQGFLGITSTFWGVNMSCLRTQNGDPSGARTPDLWIRSPKC